MAEIVWIDRPTGYEIKESDDQRRDEGVIGGGFISSASEQLYAGCKMRRVSHVLGKEERMIEINSPGSYSSNNHIFEFLVKFKTKKMKQSRWSSEAV